MPKDVRWAFGNRREYKSTTGQKTKQLSKAEIIRDVIVENFKRQVRMVRTGRNEIDFEALSRVELLHREHEKSKSVYEVFRSRFTVLKSEDSQVPSQTNPDISRTHLQNLKRKMEWLKIPSKVRGKDL